MTYKTYYCENGDSLLTQPKQSCQLICQAVLSGWTIASFTRQRAAQMLRRWRAGGWNVKRRR